VNMIEIKDLRVDYGDFTAVHDLSLSIDQGEIYGFIGPNGAGKTSTFKVLGTLLEPTFGEVTVGGYNVAEQPREVHRILGYMPDFPPVYEDLRVWEFCDLFHAAYGLPSVERKGRIDKVLKQTSLTEKRMALCGGLSRGMKQRLLLAKTLLQEPKVLILDEPASGLDPHSRIELREILKELASEGRTILISSHILTEMEGFCTSIGIIEQGRLKVSGTIEEVIRQIQPARRLLVEIIAPDPRVGKLLEDFHGVKDVQSPSPTKYNFQFTGKDAEVAKILAHLVGQSIPVKSFHEDRMDVEDVFMKVSKGEVN
jgi:ABC-2 type transport system ATP-binding protein